jgi:hypothetical protein
MVELRRIRKQQDWYDYDVRNDCDTLQEELLWKTNPPIFLILLNNSIESGSAIVQA